MPDYINDILNLKLFISLVIALSLLALKLMIVRLIKRKSEVLSDQQRRWIYHTKNITLVYLVKQFVTYQVSLYHVSLFPECQLLIWSRCRARVPYYVSQ